MRGSNFFSFPCKDFPQIYKEVWGEEYFYDDSNIMAIISRLRKKLEVNPSSPKYIQTVKGIGYRFNKEV